jgi:hypothetical protein
MGTKDIAASIAGLKDGDKFTVAGIGYDADGWLVFNGYRGDGKRSRALCDAQFEVHAGVISSLPAKIEVKKPGPKPRRYGPKSRRAW